MDPFGSELTFRQEYVAIVESFYIELDGLELQGSVAGNRLSNQLFRFHSAMPSIGERNAYLHSASAQIPAPSESVASTGQPLDLRDNLAKGDGSANKFFAARDSNSHRNLSAPASR
jgi:hypothetical protein